MADEYRCSKPWKFLWKGPVSLRRYNYKRISFHLCVVFRLQRPSWTKKTVSFLTWPLLTFAWKGTWFLYTLLPWMSQSPLLSPSLSQCLPVSPSVFQCLPIPPSLSQSRCSPYLGVFHALSQSSEGLRRYASSCFVSAVALATAIGPPPCDEVGCVCVLEENVSIPGPPL